AALIRLGIGAKWFKDYTIPAQAEIFDTFIENETAYRTPGTWKRLFEQHGFSVRVASEDDIRRWASSRELDLLEARRAVSPISVASRNFMQTVLLMRKN